MTLEKTLRTSVRTVLMPTLTACLRSMSGVNLDDLDTMPGSFVGQETVKLLKRPAMEAAFGFDVLLVLATSDVRRDTDVFQVFQDKGTALWGVVYNPFGKYMVMVLMLPKQFARKFFQVPFGRFRTTFFAVFA